MSWLTILSFLGAGAFGAFVKDCVQDNKLHLPYRENNTLVLGFVGGMIVGAFVGLAVDQSFVTAVLAGYAGTSAIEHLLLRDKRRDEKNPEV